VTRPTNQTMLKALGNILGKLMATHVELHTSEVCPECGSQLAREAGGWGELPREPLGVAQSGSPGVSSHQSAEWHCPNPDCPTQVLASIRHWCSPEVMGIAVATSELVAQLVNRGLVRDVAELYTLKHAEVDALEGMDEAKTDAFFDAIAASKKREAWRVLFGLRIPRVTASVAKSPCQQFRTLDDLFAAGAKRLMAADGMDEAVAQSIIRWHSDSLNRKLVDRLRRADVNFKC
jgi:DNA ligase (NAD+)